MLTLCTCNDDPRVRELLGLSIFSPTTEKLDSLCAAYDSSTRSRLFRFRLNAQTVGCIGVGEIEHGHAVIQHLAVLPTFRMQGVGAMMIDGVISTLGLHTVEAETDGDTFEFYQRLGFAIESLGERYPGVERFRCVLQRERG